MVSEGGKRMKEETITVTITLPKFLVDKVEAEASIEMRSRSGQIANIIKTHFDDKESIKR